MKDVFIAYARPERPIAEALAKIINDRGHSTWWDTDLLAGEDFNRVIQDRLNEARAVIVIWSDLSVKSDWVLAEAGYAARLKKLIPIIVGSLNPKDLPIPFNVYQTHIFNQTDKTSVEALLRSLSLLIRRRVDAEDAVPSAEIPPAEQPRPGQKEISEELEKPWVFVSHVDVDKPRIRPFVEKMLESELTVFIDKPAKLGLSKKWVGSPNLKYIRFFDNYRMAISRALDRSGCVLVFWSKESVQTERQIFWDEIEFGSVNGFLVSTMIDDVISGASKIPKGFGFSQANIADLTSNEALDNDFEWVIADIRELLQGYRSNFHLPGKKD
ncbi:hypothetical protein Rvan_2790 [Rhodomicrobium vannielii ATCC 17100]|uniref:TIR domain-containing protein n=1 Tax=Rhodomicrobium vannielii (strain ATCC 17100 / DSM 162 / LMG 4299 / NCIMB 10020 / ATH 3.1.1) TaxID=648757 RepID=E3I8M0_RHOVT|nr:toll/interleukin-1 receptor domain-containing protein [Rhodomicrobium vannielii]ADP71999.1 hypothetical protein Rvan_2790 [Rhodomicrobium vannielii ATCC 17100]